MKILFLGASNTYGSGVHVLNGEYDTIEKVKSIDQKLLATPITNNGRDFTINNRWSTKVAKYLNRIEINESRAGGSPAETLHILQNTDLTDIDYICIEFSNIYSYFDRYFFSSDFNNLIPRTPGEIEEFLTNGKKDRPELRKKIKEWVINFDPKAFIDEVMTQFELELSKPRMKDKKIIVVWWRPHIIDNQVFDPDHYTFLKKYAVKFPYPGGENNYSADTMIKKFNYTVHQEHPLGKYMGYPDDHAGVKGNQLVADCIIKHLNKNGMKKRLLIAGDSFSADWTKKFKQTGWVNRLDEYDVTNISQAGVSEYKIYKQLKTIDLSKFDFTIICHTSPYRIPVQEHPIHSKDLLHKNSDLIYADLIPHKKTKLVKYAIDFFENFFDQDYAVFVHNLIIDEIIKTAPNALHITFFENERNDIVNFHHFFKKYRGLINHLNEVGNIKVLDKITELLNDKIK